MPACAVALAYFTVVEDQRTGWTGGLLLLSSGGRPLEFQCTLPVRPSRAHEILFGVSLREHLIGEVIGPLLVKKCRTPISMLCCDQPESLAMDVGNDYPIALVVDAAEQEEGPISNDTLTGCGDIMLAGTQLLVPMEQVEQANVVADQMKDLADASEPFERIREAIKEAQSQIARSQQANQQAAA
jgi:hypothetical protein